MTLARDPKQLLLNCVETLGGLSWLRSQGLAHMAEVTWLILQTLMAERQPPWLPQFTQK